MGAMSFGGKGYWEKIGALNENSAQHLVDIAFDAGVNFLTPQMSILTVNLNKFLAKQSKVKETKLFLQQKFAEE